MIKEIYYFLSKILLIISINFERMIFLNFSINIDYIFLLNIIGLLENLRLISITEDT